MICSDIFRQSDEAKMTYSDIVSRNSLTADIRSTKGVIQRFARTVDLRSKQKRKEWC